MGLLHPSGGGSGLPGSLGGQLLPGSLSSGRLASGLLSSCHDAYLLVVGRLIKLTKFTALFILSELSARGRHKSSALVVCLLEDEAGAELSDWLR